MKVAVFYYMRLEDKYWVLFFASLVLLCALYEYGTLPKESEGRLRYIAGYGLLSYIVVFSSFVYEVVSARFPWFEAYYELSHIVGMVPVIAIAVTAAFLLLYGKEKRRIACLFAGFVVLLCLAGDFVLFPPAQQEWNYDFSQEEEEIYEMMMTHAQERGVEEVTFWGTDELMFKSIFYNENLEPVYRKDILSENASYGEGVRQMYEGYQKYAERKYGADRLCEFAYALAGLPHIYPEVACDYVVVYRPEVHMEDPEGETTFRTEQMTEVFGEYEYEQVGCTDNRVVYFKGKEK